MADKPLPKSLQRLLNVNPVDEMWHKILNEGNSIWSYRRHLFGRLPSNLRCVNCHRPFEGKGGTLLRTVMGVHKSPKNPKFCADCHPFTSDYPGFAGRQRARLALEAGQTLLRVPGYGEPDGPWIPVGVGTHTGLAWVGSIVGPSGAGADFTALGDNVYIAARLASRAGAGEVLASEATCNAAGIKTEGLEKRDLERKGKRELICVRVLHAEGIRQPSGPGYP